MDISLVHTGLAAGAGLAALPVILHLFMKQTPKHVIFPALRLIRERQKRSRKKLRVKNWLLLLARMAILALMALALARPTMMSQGSLGDSDVPTAIGLVFDTSLSMEYTERDKTRLDEAKTLAYSILDRTSGSSQVFVVDAADPTATPLTPATARKRVEALTTRPVNRSLNAAVGVAYAAVSQSDRPRHEVYVLTDLARSAWDLDRPAEGLDKVKALKSGIKTYVLRLTPKEVHDVAVLDARPSADVVTEGEAVEVRARLHSIGPATKGVAKLWLDDLPRGDKTVDLPANGDVEVSFVIPTVDAKVPLHQGKVQFSGTPDPLKFDDVRYFTFSLKPAVRVLIVSDESIDGDFIAAAIDPEKLPAGAARPFRAERIKSTEFLDHAENLGKQYRVIFLNNVERLGDDAWAKLRGFVLDGGGLVVGVGNRSQGEHYGSNVVRAILPASIEQIVPPKDGTTFGEITDLTHPLFRQYEKDLRAMLLQVPVVKYWGVTVPETSRVLLTYADKAPALIERVFKGPKTGRVMLWTTPLSRRPDSTSDAAWNEFPVSLGWSFPYLMNQTVSYLAGATDEALNFEAGRDVILPIDPTRRFKNYTVQGPDRKNSDRLTPTENTDSLAITAQDRGQWTVTASGEDGKTSTLGFSVNAPTDESRFVPLETADLEKLFGKDGYAPADDARTLVDEEKKYRFGRELFPWVMMLIMVVVTAESVLANRFYRESAAALAARTTAAQAA